MRKTIGSKKAGDEDEEEVYDFARVLEVVAARIDTVSSREGEQHHLSQLFYFTSHAQPLFKIWKQ